MNIKEYIQQLKEERKGLSFAFLAERVPVSESAPNRINKASPIKPAEPMVLVLTGEGEQGSDNIRGHNGYVKKVDEFVKNDSELKDKHVRVCVAVCNTGKLHDPKEARELYMLKTIAPKEYDERMAGKNEISKKELLRPAYIQDIFNEVILPRISANNGNIRLSQVQAMRNIRRLNIVAHCHGTYVARCLEDMMQEKMTELNYPESERKKIQKQLLVLNYAADCLYSGEKSRFIYFDSAADSHNRYQPRFKEWLQMTGKKFGLLFRRNYWFMCTKIDKAGIEGNPKRVLIARKIDGNFFQERAEAYQKAKENEMKEPEEEKYLGEHDFLGFLPKQNMSKAAMKMQRFFGNILSKAVLNSCMQEDGTFVPLPSTASLAAKTTKDKIELIKARFVAFGLIQQFAHRNNKKLNQFIYWHQHNRLKL